MSIRRLSLILLILVLLYCTTSFPSDDAGHTDSDSEVESSNDLVQENPDYEGPPIPPEPPEEALDGLSSEDDLKEDTQERKAAINMALSKSSPSKSRGGIVCRTSVLLRKHGLKITLVLAIYAFRKEIRSLLWNLFSKPVQDPQTGEWVRRPVPVRPTSILKILIFVDVMRRLQSSSDNQTPSPLMALLLAGGRGNPALAIFLSKLLEPSNSAYIPPVEQHYTFERINNRYNKDADALRRVLMSRASQSLSRKPVSLPKLFMEMETKVYNETVVLLDWTNLDTSVSSLNSLRDEVSFLLSQYRNESWSEVLTLRVANDTAPALKKVELEVVVLLESPGGSAADYALAAQQILRLRQSGIQVTICVDKVAASGGYMIACTSSPGRLFAAPFAVVGSIGVVGQSLNIHKTLKGWGVEPLVFRGGRDKAPVGLIGEVTEEGLQKVQNIVDNTHRAFKKHVSDARPVLADRIEELATGDIWLGYDAMDIGLVDRLVTSDEYVEERLARGARVLKLLQLQKPKYPFSRPTTSTQGRLSPISVFKSLFHTMTDFQVLLQGLSDRLRELVASDGPVWPTVPKTSAYVAADSSRRKSALSLS